MRNSGGWEIRGRHGSTWVGCEPLDLVPGVAHLFATRRTRGAAGTDVDLPRTLVLRQVHGNRVHRIRAAADGGVPAEGDGLVALRGDAPEVSLGVRSADCVPVLLAERSGVAVAAVHAGWRGVAANIAGSALERLVDCGVDPLQVVVALGPAIGPCCYEVGEEVAREVARAGGGQPARILEPGGSSGAVRIDLRSALRDQLVARGVPDSAIHEAPWCTACTPRLFHSFRRDGERSGRQIAAIGWALGAVA